VIGGPIASSPEQRKRGPKSRIEYGSVGGPVLGSQESAVPRLKTNAAHLHRLKQEA
jgi:hypothetical protein